MITDLNETIRQLLIQKGPLDPGEVDISFETPDREWAASISNPTINLYLYDIRENHELRATEGLTARMLSFPKDFLTTRSRSVVFDGNSNNSRRGRCIREAT